MTKRELARQIYQSVQNHDSQQEAIEAIEALLSTLVPKDPKRFKNWGYPPQTGK